MGEDSDDDAAEDDRSRSSGEEDEEDAGDEVDGRDGRHSKIKFNNSHWGTGAKKNYKPSSTLNRRRPKKYLSKINEILDERKEEAKAEMREKAAAELSDLEAATLDLRDK